MGASPPTQRGLDRLAGALERMLDVCERGIRDARLRPPADAAAAKLVLEAADELEDDCVILRAFLHGMKTP